MLIKTTLLSILLFTITSSSYAQDGHIDTIPDSYGNKHLNKVMQYPGNIEGLNKDISAFFVYPKKAQVDKVHGEILLEFTVDTLGRATRPKIIKGIRADVDSAVVNVTKKLKRFKPALMDGRKVSQKMNIPLTL